MDNTRTIILAGNTFKLGGKALKNGDKAPNFTALGIDYKPKTLEDFAGKTIILSSVTSLDTQVCDTETRRFNEIAGKLSNDIAILTISMDLPAAQRRWCGAAGIEKVTVLSDHRTAEFGGKYGVLIPDLRLLARCVFVVDKKGLVRYQQLVPEIAREPNYDEVVEATKKVL